MMRPPPSIPNVRPFCGLIGVARKDITPPVSIYSRSWGAAKHDVAEGIHRPLTLTCLTFQKSADDSPLVLISADLGWWKSVDEKEFRQGILDGLSLRPSQLMVCLTHTHSGPSLSTENAANRGGDLIAPYLKQVRKSIIRAVETALSRARRSFLSWRYDKCTLATCRDLPDPKANRYIVGYNPDVPADDTLLVGRVTDETHKVVAVIVNYACHPTTLAWQNTRLSPDYVGAMRQTVEQQTSAPCLFLQGASGELSPAEQYVGELEIPETHGRRLGYAVLSALEAMLPADSRLEFSGVVESGAPLAIWTRKPQEASLILLSEMMEMELPLKDLPSVAEIQQRLQNCTDHVLKERLWRQRAVRKIVGDGKNARFGVWIWRLGDSLLIGQPNEPYSKFQIDLRKLLAPCPVAVMNITNGSIGYLPPRELFNYDLYQVWQTPFESGGLELVTEKTSRAAQALLRSE
ncbi:MAG TPA: neutral/alkaline non-lysosomal ceramidase N-terminal domain-containing protein [Patescibacteria group bacterium]|nr:neutral/alkaline non-lysosomal ceramidase N-terminal domain-containing protein [Patescibacteria group bacterium]